MINKVLLIILISVSFAFSIERTKYLMGTYVSINLPKENKYLFKPSFNIIKQVDLKFSKYNPKSYLYKLNKHKKAKIDKEFLKLLNISLQINKKTYGYFDISLGNLTKKYGSFYIKENKNQKYTIGIENIKIKDGYIYLLNNISLDFGAIGKGYAIDKISNFLEKKKVKKAIIKLSGDIRCFDICNICIKNPFKEGFIKCFKTKYKNTSISTSGNYERYIKTKENNHLINPKTKKSEKNFASITLIGIKNNTYLDAYTTAVSVMPEKLAIKFLEENKIGYFIIKINGEILINKKFKSMVEFTNNIEK
ncbi:FAD:protein FMN transferase [Hydrogenothermus marinus]|uniref:FAD:protein FMN transferase n=1 Tax=Hydrogenothermus marinus TaxID=133270 RepID=A0A3M0BID7_9AQUI|nr:FAD:protein FMN transferase [Hydrogenothermus marinus]RMA96089.1 thiamine biosynthesis lipoprotein [Hydrogenothermus marinus]